MAGRGDEVAYAANWRAVLAVDASLGVVAAVAGVVVVALVSVVGGSLLVLGGLLYVAAVARRYVRWQRLRTDAGLDA
jgi:hypothetical protein